ncbi:MAG: hypothetical protein AAF961_13360 [Planctomycetota bacterium]
MRSYGLLAILATAGLAGVGCRSVGWLPAEADAFSSAQVTHRGQSIGSQLVLHGDFAFPPNNRLVKELVAQRAIINDRLQLPETDRPIHVHLYVDEDSYEENVIRRFPKFPQRRAIFVDDGLTLAVYAQRGAYEAVDLRHEVAHGYLHAAVPNIPLWLDEGLAEYFEVARGQSGINVPHVELLLGQMEVADWKPDLLRLQGLDDAATMSQLDYAEAWLWVHFLLSSSDRSDVIIGYLADLGATDVPAPISVRIRRKLAHPTAALLEHLRSLAP